LAWRRKRGQSSCSCCLHFATSRGSLQAQLLKIGLGHALLRASNIGHRVGHHPVKVGATERLGAPLTNQGGSPSHQGINPGCSLGDAQARAALASSWRVGAVIAFPGQFQRRAISRSIGRWQRPATNRSRLGRGAMSTAPCHGPLGACSSGARACAAEPQVRFARRHAARQGSAGRCRSGAAAHPMQHWLEWRGCLAQSLASPCQKQAAARPKLGRGSGKF